MRDPDDGSWGALAVVGLIGFVAPMVKRRAGSLFREQRTGGGGGAPPTQDGGGGGGGRRYGSFRLHSAPFINTAAFVRLTEQQYRRDPDWSIDALVEGYELHPQTAEALASGFVQWRQEAGAEGPVVVFTYDGGFGPVRPPLFRALRSLAQQLNKGPYLPIHNEREEVQIGELADALSFEAMEFVRGARASSEGDMEEARRWARKLLAAVERFPPFDRKDPEYGELVEKRRRLRDALVASGG